MPAAMTEANLCGLARAFAARTHNIGAYMQAQVKI